MISPSSKITMKSREGRETKRKGNHGSHSLSTSRERNPSCFYKLMLFPIIHSKKLRIPELFSRAYSEELSGSVILTVSTGESWKVTVIKEDNNLWFREGWKEFVERFSIAFAYFLLFLYQGNSKFEVHIFSPTACEISYPRNPQNEFPAEKSTKGDDSNDVGARNSGTCSAPNDSDSIVEDPSINRHEERKSGDDIVSDRFTVKSLSGDDDMELGEDEGRVHSSETNNEKSDEGSMHRNETNDANEVTETVEDEYRETQSEELMEALASVGIPTLRKPFFVTLIKKHNIYKGCYVSIPAVFAQKYLNCKARKHAKLEASDGKQWKVEYFPKPNRVLRKGWIAFARENRLKVGDVCVFEVCEARNLVLKVHVGVKSQLTKQNRWTQLLNLKA